MTKSSATPAPAVTVTVTPALAPVKKPTSLTIVGPGYLAFAEAAVHVRNGYTFLPGVAPTIMETNGNAVIQLVLGCPHQSAVDAATATVEHALALEQVEFDKSVAAAAKRLFEQDKQAQIQKQLDAELKEHKANIAKLQAAVAESQAKQAAIL